MSSNLPDDVHVPWPSDACRAVSYAEDIDEFDLSFLELRLRDNGEVVWRGTRRDGEGTVGGTVFPQPSLRDG